MNLLFDTNIIIYIAWSKSGFKLLNFLNPLQKDIHVSFATIAEIESFALQNQWGKSKIQRLELLLDEAQIIQIDDMLLSTYVNIDAFSQCKHSEFTTYPHLTPRNMGKHDIWIAATASLLSLQLVTTDNDFHHLQDTFFELCYIEPQVLHSYL
jgi:predicted nucleic acid-binding protein